MQPRLILLAAMFALAGFAGKTFAQEKGTLEPVSLPPLAHPEDPSTPAKQLFGRQVVPAALAARTIGFYSHGCLAGGEALPVNGSAWQVMRLSRNRNWGHPALLAFLERFARKVPTVSHWPGILVGDMSQPRGGPMLTGHASHQIGLDADIWLTPMPNRELSRLEREEMSAANMVRPDRLDIDPAKWTRIISRSSRPPHRIPRFSAFSSTPRSRKRSAGRRVATGHGLPRSAPIMDMTIIFTSVSLVRPGKTRAGTRTLSRPGTAAMPRSLGGSRTLFCIQDQVLKSRNHL